MTASPTPAAFRKFSADIAPAANAVLMAQAFAEIERERVAAYILPIFHGYRFIDKRTGEPITDPDRLYLVEDLDDPLVLAFYADCDQAHRAHGFTGPAGHCPALTAEHLHTVTEWELIKLAAPFFGINPDALAGEHRARFLDLVIKSCLQAAPEKFGVKP